MIVSWEEKIKISIKLSRYNSPYTLLDHYKEHQWNSHVNRRTFLPKVNGDKYSCMFTIHPSVIANKIFPVCVRIIYLYNYCFYWGKRE